MIVLDTSFLAGSNNQRDPHFAAAHTIEAELHAGRWGEGVLLEYVMIELMNVLVIRRGAAAAARAGRFLLRSDLKFVPCSSMFDATFTAFCAQQHTRLGLVDVAISEYARAHAGGYVATFDRELACQPGIIAIPG